MITIENILNKTKYIRADLELKAKELGIKGYHKLSKDALAEAIVKTDGISQPDTPPKINLYSKKTIPKTLKNDVWDEHIGREKGIGECFTCHKEIDSKFFECGHVIAEVDGGDNTISNLRPVCSLCNKSMGKTNMNDFKDKLAQSSKIIILNQFLEKYNFLLEQPNIIQSYKFPNFHNESTEKDLLSKMKYDTLIFNNITKLWCSVNKINEFVSQYSKDNNSLETSINYITINENYCPVSTGDKTYKEICKHKLIRWLADNNMTVIDVTNKKINPKSKETILKENCHCKNTNEQYNNSNNSGFYGDGGHYSSQLYGSLANRSGYTQNLNHTNMYGQHIFNSAPKLCKDCGDEIKYVKFTFDRRLS